MTVSPADSALITRPRPQGGLPMNTLHTPIVNCAICCTEIPLSAALTPESMAYVAHFYGPACLQRFSARAEHETVPAATPSSESNKTDQAQS